jgi:tricorn protease-like protein
MKLELIKRYEPDNIQFFMSCVAVNNETAICLTIDNADNYALLFVSPGETKDIPLNYLETFTKTDNKPILFAKGGSFGIIKNPNELFIYQNMNDMPNRIEIDGKKLFQAVLPSETRLCYPNPISNGDMLPVCFQHTTFLGVDARYVAFLSMNIEKQKARWESWTNLDNKKFPVVYPGQQDPPKIDSVMVKDDSVFVFTSGGSITSVNKWGMDYYGIVKTTKKGEIIETLLDSGNLRAIDRKKRGVNGVFSSSQKYAILTPVFQSDEWKGKQKLFSIETKELIEVEFPRGFDKYPQIVQHSGLYFWVYLRETKHIAICKQAK